MNVSDLRELTRLLREYIRGDPHYDEIYGVVDSARQELENQIIK
jgi:hypothetical protein